MRIPPFLARHGWLIAIAAAYLYLFPYFPKIRSANELPRVYLIKAIAEDQTFAIDRGVARWGSTADVSPSRGHLYSNKAPGSSMLAVPAYAAVRAVAGEPSLGASVWLARVFAGIVPMLLFLHLLWGFLARFAPDPAVRRLVLLAYAFGSMAMTYSILFYSHQLGAICIASGWILATDVADRRRGPRAMLAAGGLAGAAALVDYQAVFAAVPVAVFVVARMWRTHSRGELGKAIGLAAMAAAAPIAILLAYHAACFGSPWATGYDASTTFAHFHQQGFLGITELRWEAFYGSFLRRDNGLVTLAPWLLLAIPGGFALAWGRTERAAVEARRHGWIVAAVGAVMVAGGVLRLVLAPSMPSLPYRISAFAVIAAGLTAIAHGVSRTRIAVPSGRGRDRGAVAVGIAVAAIYVLFISSINFWRGGWGVGPRYITAMLPFLLPLIAAMLQALADREDAIGRYGLGVAAGLIVIGVVVYALSSATFPYWPDSMEHPLYDVTFRMLADDVVAPSAGSAIGIGGVAGILPYLAIVFGLLGWTIVRIGGWRALAIAAVIGASVLAGYGLFERGGAQADRAYGFVRSAATDL